MVPDLSFLRNTFLKYNDLIFRGELPMPKLSLTKANTFRGKLCYRINRKFLKTKYEDFDLRLSLNFDLDPSEWEDVVIHEMIHLYIAHAGIKDTSSHGRQFRKLMHDINKEFGRNIVISTKSNPLSRVGKPINQSVKAHFICVARFKDGRLGVAPVAKTRIFDLWDRFPYFPNLLRLRWIGTTDIWFNNLPKVLVPKFYLMEEEILKDHLRGARFLERKGKIIKVENRRVSPDDIIP